MSTAAPTRTKSSTSAASQSLPNFSESRPETKGMLPSLRVQAMPTTARSPDTGTTGFAQLSTASSRKAAPSSRITFILFRT